MVLQDQDLKEDMHNLADICAFSLHQQCFVHVFNKGLPDWKLHTNFEYLFLH
jgi:hypothetical protein